MADIDDVPASEESPLEQEGRREAAEEARRAAVRRAGRRNHPLRRAMGPQEILGLVGGFGFLALLLAAMVSSIINPIFPLAALIFFLYPFRRVVVPRRTMQLGIIAFIVWLFFNLSGALFPFIIAFILAYLFSPLVHNLAQRGIPRWATSLTIVLLILGGYTLVGIFVVPNLVEQFRDLASMEELLRSANALLDRDKLINTLTSYGLPRNQATELVTTTIEPQIREIASLFISQISEFVRNISTILEGVVNLVLIPILAFYMMLDFDRIRLFVRSTILQDNPKYVYYVKNVDVILSSYLRGILLTSSLVGGMAIAFLSIADVPYAVLIGVLTGVFNLIPTVGIFLNLGVAMLVYLFAPGAFWYNTLMTAVMVLGLHALNGYVIEPRVIGDRVGLHPVLLIASLFTFAHFLGFVGLLIAVPTSAVILMFLKEWYRNTVALRSQATVPPAAPS